LRATERLRDSSKCPCQTSKTFTSFELIFRLQKAEPAKEINVLTILDTAAATQEEDSGVDGIEGVVDRMEMLAAR
jgi:hypothetical protein